MQIARQSISRAAVRPANDIAAGAVPDENAAKPVWNCGQPVAAGADIITEDNISRCIRVSDEDAVLRIARNDVARLRVGAAESVLARAAGDEDSLKRIRCGVCAAGTNTEPAAGDRIVRRVGIFQRHACLLYTSLT